MAFSDPDDQPRSGYTFLQWLNGIIQAFRGGSTRQFLLSPSDNMSGAGDAPPILAMAARSRIKDTKGVSLYYSRMEEAKIKNEVWNNNLRPVVEDRLRRIFHEENYKRMKMLPNVSSNMLRRIVEDISILYESPARRKLSDDTQDQTDASSNKAVSDAEQAASASPTQKANPAAPSNGIPVLDTGTPEVDALAQYLDLEGGSEEDHETPLDTVMDLEDLDLTLDLVEKLCRFHDAVWVRPYVKYETINLIPNKETNVEEEVGDPSTGKLCYLIYDPSSADVIEDPDDPSRALCWYHSSQQLNSQGVSKMVWHFYTPTDYWMFDDEWHTILHEPNPLGRLPVTVFRKEKPTPGSYYVDGCGRDLLEGTLELAVLRTIQNCRFKDSGFKQLVMQGASEEDVPADQIMGGPTPLYVPEGSTASVLDLQPMLVEMSTICKERNDEIAGAYGVNFAEHKPGSVPQSGFAKKLERDKILKENKRIRKFFCSSEQDLYNNLSITLATYPIEGVPALDSTGKLEIDFSEPSFEQDPKDQSIIDAQDLKLNKTNIVEILKRLNPDLNDVELLEMAERNRQINMIFLRGDQMKLIDLLATAGRGGQLDPQAAQEIGGTPVQGPPKQNPGGGGF